MRTKRFFLSAIIIALLAGSVLVGKGPDKKTLKFWGGRTLQACAAASLIVYIVKHYEKNNLEATLGKICVYGTALVAGQLLVDS